MSYVARHRRWLLVLGCAALVAGGLLLHVRAQGRGRGATQDPAALRAQRNALERQLEDIAVVDRRVMVPMRDGKRMMADIYRPKGAPKVPIVFSRTPYNVNWWDVTNGAPKSMQSELDAVKRGYAYVAMNERGHYFSEGDYDILGPPLTDGYDAIQWLTTQPWSDGKLGTIGCSSTAEWQLGVAAQGAPGFTTMIPESFGAGVGRVKPYYEQGNWYRGGAVQMLFIDWIYGEQNQVRPMFPPGTSQADLIQASKMFDLAPKMPPVDWTEALKHLPETDIIKAVGGPKGIFADHMPGIATGGAMIERTPNDPAWYKGGLFHDDMKVNIPGLWFFTWYDVGVSPNLAAYNYVRRTARPDIADQQYAIIAPQVHCGYPRSTEDTVVGERHVGDARLAMDTITYDWFDHYLLGKDNGVPKNMPKVRYYVMGANRWETAETWPPAGVEKMTFYLDSGGKANTLNGDGTLLAAAPAADHQDAFTYDPMNPVASHGGNVCCEGNAVSSGALDQRVTEQRPDVLVYTSQPFAADTEASGPIDVTLYVSSDAKDTDFTVKVLDVYPDGTAYNLDETIQRMRYRNGYDQPLVWMTPGAPAKVTFQPMTFSNSFLAGHRLRIEVSSSNFPRFDRNLDTGGNNYDESKPVVAHNGVHHAAGMPSSVTLSVVRHPALYNTGASPAKP